MLKLNDILDQTDLTNIYRTLHPNTSRSTFISEAHKTVSEVDYLSGDKARLKKDRKIEIFPHVITENNRINQ